MMDRVVPEIGIGARLQGFVRGVAICLYLFILAWAPFPLGGAIAWAPGAQTVAIAACALLWVAGSAGRSEYGTRGARMIAVPLVLVSFTLLWAVIQIAPVVPADWAHPVWQMAADALGRPMAATISLNPWRTESEIVKLASYVLAAYLAFRMSRQAQTARFLLNAIIAIGALYALYAFILHLSGVQQVNLFYAVPYKSQLLSGPFMLHNSFATYSGMTAIAALVLLFAQGSKSIVSGRGSKRYIASLLQFCFGRGTPLLVAFLITLSAVVVSASRAGFAAIMFGLVAVALVSIPLARGRTTLWPAVGALAAAAPLLVIVIFNGETLVDRLDLLFASDAGDPLRFSLWEAAYRMIQDAPWLGLGLGAFQDAYPMYATTIYPFVMDKAHSDYLEFAAGIGLPAAIAWWAALLWLGGLCLRAVFVRHRDRIYSVIALGATVLVAVHSAVDFSLQLPAVALLYATLLGMGVAQSQSSREASSV